MLIFLNTTFNKDKQNNAFTFAYSQHSYPWPAIGQKPPILPVGSRKEKQSGKHHKDPHDQVNNIEHIIKAHRVFHPKTHNHGHHHSDQQSQQVWIRFLSLTWNQTDKWTVWGTWKMDKDHNNHKWFV